MSLSLTISPDIRTLLENIYERIKTERRTIFYKPTIVISTYNLKKTVEDIFLRNDNICININFTFLEPFLGDIFSKMLNLDEENTIILTLEKNKIILASMIFNILLDEEFQKKHQEVFKVIKQRNISPNYEVNYLWNMALKFSSLFREYEYHRYDEIIYQWHNGKWAYGNEKGEHLEEIQRDIYKIIFIEGYFFKNKSKKYFTLVQLYNQVKNTDKNKLNLQVLEELKKFYMFGFSQISEIHFKMLLFLKDHLDIEFFMPNYLKEIYTEKERIFHSFPYEILEDSISNQKIHPIGRNEDAIDDFNYPMIATSFLIKNLLSVEELHTIWVEKTSTPTTLLEAVRHLFTTHRSEKKWEQDDSLKIISASSKFQEVEMVYNSILYNITTDESLSFDDILILVPDMKKYRHIIIDTFSRNPYDSHPEIRERGKIPFHIYDKNLYSQSLFYKALNSIYNLIKSNFSKDYLNEIITNPLVIAKFGIKENQSIISTFKKWIMDMNLFDEEFKITSFTNGMRRMMMGIIMERHSSDEEYLYEEIVPYSDNQSDLQTISCFAKILHILLNLKNEFSENYRLSEWIDKIKYVINELIDTANFPEENYIEVVFRRNLKLLEEIERLNKARKYSFEEFFMHISSFELELLKQTGSALFNGVSVSTFLQMKSIPFKVVYILGMNEGEFPEENDRSPFNLRNLRERYNDIDRKHSDNFLFLEAIINAEKKVYISFVGYNPEEDIELHPSSTLSAFIDILNEKLLKKNYEIIRLPKTSLSIKYLTEEKHPDLYTNIFYTPHRIISLIKYGALDANKFIPELKEPSKKQQIIKIPEVIELKSLAEFLKNPLEEMLKVKFGIYDKVESEYQNLRNLSLKNYDKHTIVNSVIATIMKNINNQNFDALKEFEKLYNYFYYSGRAPENEILRKLEVVQSNIIKIQDYLVSYLPQRKTRYYEKISVGEKSNSDSNQTLYFDHFETSSKKKIKARLNNVLFDGSKLIMVRYTSTIDDKLRYRSPSIHFKLFLSILSYILNREILGEIIYLNSDLEPKSLYCKPVDRDDFEKIVNYYCEENNLHLLPVEIVSQKSCISEIISTIEKEENSPYKTLYLSETIRMQRTYEKFIPERLTSYSDWIKKITYFSEGKYE